MSYQYADFIRDCITVLDGYTGDLPTAKARKYFHQQHASTHAALDLLHRDEFRLCLPAMLEGYPDGKRFIVSLESLLLRFADQENGKYPDDARHLRWQANVFSGQQLEVAFCSRDTEAAVREQNAAVNELRSAMTNPRNYNDLSEALYVLEELFWSSTNFWYPDREMGTMGFPTGLLLHLIASAVQGDDEQFSVAIRQYADIHYNGELQLDFDLPDGSNVGIWELQAMDPAEAAQLLTVDVSYRPLPGSIKFSYNSDECVYSPTAEAGFPLKVYLSEYEDDFDEKYCLLIGSKVAFIANWASRPASACSEKQVA